MPTDPNSEFSNYILRRLETSLFFEEHSSYRMIHLWSGEIEATADIRFYQRRRGWTGKGIEASPRIRATTDGRQLSARRHGPVYREGDDEFFLVDIGERIARGNRVAIETESLFVDEAGTFQPFLSATVRPSLENLTLGVITPTPVAASYHFGDLVEPVPSVPFESDEFPSHFKHEISIDDPALGQHHIQWSWL